MILSAHQPAYLPWLGYFEKIQASDIFVYLDTVQYEKNSFINRNKIKTPNGWQWLTIPVRSKGHLNTTLFEIEVDEKQPWRTKHLKSIEMNYKNAHYFSHSFVQLQQIMSISNFNLADLCWEHLNFWLNKFEIKTKIVRSSELNLHSKNSDLIMDLCNYFSIKKYYSGALGGNYLNELKFLNHGIKITYQNFNHPVYEQMWGKFVPYMSIVDYWMNCGSGAIRFNNSTTI